MSIRVNSIIRLLVNLVEIEDYTNRNIMIIKSVDFVH
nr:MAG TPA: hypothetical protein [Caudoviricetes sp.]